MADLNERVSALETRAAQFDREIIAIKAEQDESRSYREEANVSLALVMQKLDDLIKKLSEKKETKFKATEIIMSLGMIFIALWEVLKK